MNPFRVSPWVSYRTFSQEIMPHTKNLLLSLSFFVDSIIISSFFPIFKLNHMMGVKKKTSPISRTTNAAYKKEYHKNEL